MPELTTSTRRTLSAWLLVAFYFLLIFRDGQPKKNSINDLFLMLVVSLRAGEILLTVEDYAE